jgi:hypothetical protein
MTIANPARIGRRSLLRSLGGAGAACAGLVPLLDAGRAGAASFPRRLVVMVMPEGTIQDRFWPTGGETDFKLGPITAPLEPLRDDILVVRGVDMKSAKDDPAVHGGHDNYVHLLAGVKSATGARGDHNLGTAAVGAGGISLDQFLAAQLRPPTKLASLVLGVQINWKAMQQARVSWSGFNQPVTPQEDPYKLFDSLLAGVGGREPTVDRTRAEDRSVLDFVQKDLRGVAARVGADDRRKLDQHLGALREIERGLDPRFDAQVAGCAAPVIEGDRLSVTSNPNFPVIGKLQMDLLAAALACDLTRISTFQWNSGVGNLVMSWLGPEFQGKGDEFPTRTLHDMTHRQRQTPAHTDRKARVEQWFMEQVAYFLGRLKSIREGAGTLLDNTAVVVVNHMHDGAAHSHGPALPLVIAGRCGGFYKTGRYIDLGRAPVPHQALLVSMAQAMGLDVGSFGDPAYNTKSLGLLRA